MKRRLYFLFANSGPLRRAIEDLKDIGIDLGHLHVLARPDINLDGLPPATDRQRRDVLQWLEKTLWRGNLVLFSLAFVGLLVAAVLGHLVGTVLAVAAILFSFGGGALFALRLTSTHLENFHEPLQQGALLLMVDVGRERVAAVEELMQREHPEATAGGSTWTPDALGI